MRKIYSLTIEQIELANKLEWFHALDFGDYQTAGRFPPDIPANHTLFGTIDLLDGIKLSGMRVLEIGPGHGLLAFGMAILGANVSIVNIGNSKPLQWKLAEEVYGFEIDYHIPVPLEKTQEIFSNGTFDLIVCAGVMYHLLNPSDVFFRLRPLLKQDGLILLETAYAANEKEAVLRLNSECEEIKQTTTYFLPSASAVTGLAKLACFDVIATRHNSPARFSLLGRASTPEQVRNRTETCRRMHHVNFEDPSFNIRMLEGVPKSNIVFDGQCEHKIVNIFEFETDFPTHPRSFSSIIGRRITERKPS